MRKLQFIFIFCLFQYAYTFAQQYDWVVIDPDSIPGNPDFSDVYFIDNETGWFTIHSPGLNQIYRTDDGAGSFSIQTTSLGNTKAIQMIDENNGYCGGENGWVYNTVNGGLNWNPINSMGNFLDISFPPNTDTNNPIGYACGDNGQVWQVTSTLTNLNTGFATTFSGISTPSVNSVWFCGGNRIYYYNGTTFTSQSTPGGIFTDIHFINNQEGWVVGSGGVIGHTTNGGGTWTSQINPDAQNRTLNGVFFLNDNDGWAVGVNGIILHTSNGGDTWNVETVSGLSSTAFLIGVYFTSPTNGYVVGNNQVIVKYADITGIINTNQQLEFMIFPSPVKNTIWIKCKDLITENGGIEIFTNYGIFLFGKEVKTGSDIVNLDLSHLASGIYLIRIKVGSKSVTKKIIKE